MKHIFHTIQHTARAATVLLLALLAAQTAWAQTNVSNAPGLAEAFDDTDVSEINVTDNITDVGGLSLNRDLTINLNGHTISGDYLYFNVGPDGSLTINGEGQGGSVGNIINGYAGQNAIDNGGTVTLSHVNITTNSYYAIHGGMLYIGNNVSFNGWTKRPFDTQNVNTEGGNYNYAPGNPRANVVATVTVGGTPHYFENLSVALVYFANNPGNDGFSLSGDTYTIKTAADWGYFCDMLEAGETFSGKTVELDGDIGTPEDPVTRMGSSTTQFRGTFDGAGHTLTVQYGTASEPVNQQFVAPFVEVAGAAKFTDLTIAGSIYSGYDTSDDKGTGGLIGHLFGSVTVEHCVSTVTVNAASDRAGGFVGHCEHAVTFTDCVSSAIVTCTGSGSGFVGWSRNGEHTIAFYGCLFSGKVLKQGNVGSGNGSFVGWKGFTKTVTITNCIAAPAADENMATDNSATFCRYSASQDNGETHITNCYYTAAFDIAQGKQAHTVTAGTDVTVAHAGVATHYATSGITAYKATGASADSDPFIAGLLYNNNVVDVLYAGSDEVVSLTLSNTAPGDVPDGYQYGYTTNAGTLSGSTLTMPDQDVTVSVNTDVLVAIDWATVSTGADKDNAYMIYNKDQLDLLAHRVNGTHGETAVEDGYSGKYFKLAKDIKYTHKADGEEGADAENNYEAIGGRYDDFRSFLGHFDGNNKTISGIRIYKGGDTFQGIFGLTGSGADIHHLTLADARITGYQFTGGIVGENYNGTVTRCHVAADVAVCAVRSGASYHGGIVGYNSSGTIEQCTSAATLTTADASNKNYGGIAGYNSYGTLSDNLAIGTTVPALSDNSYGAITGYNDGGTLQRNYYTACKVADTENATGVGCNNADVTANNGARAVFALTLADGITTTTAATVTIGTTGYYAQGTAIALSYTGTPGNIPEGYQYEDSYGFTASAGILSGSTLTMPAADVTVSLAFRSTHAAVPVSYVDAGGTAQKHDAIALDGTETSLNAGWYFVGTGISYSGTIYCNGNVNFILADGCTMNITTSEVNGIKVDGSLTIYGQTDGTGTLNATSEKVNGIYIDSSRNLTISGGRVTATGGNNGIYTNNGTITISGGTVTVTGGKATGIFTENGTITISGGRVTATGSAGIFTNRGTITISGGTVTATGGEGIYTNSGTITISGGTVTATSIFTESGTITLGCTNASDFIYVSRYFVVTGGTLNIADGQTLFDEDGNYYSGNDVTIPDGKTLRPGLTARQAPDQNYWTTYYNSATGFTIDDDEHACAYTATYGGSQLTLHKLGKEIPKNTAVIIVADNDVVSMTAADLDAYTGANDLRGVDVDTPVADIRSDLGTGTFYVLGMTTVDNEQHFGFHRYTGEEMAAHKAFVFVGSSPESPARSLTMVFDEASGIESLTPAAAPKAQAADLWFTLDGRRLQAKPTAPGIYVNNGRKVVIK